MPRLAILKDTLRDVALRSRNLCAFPGCSSPIMDQNGVLVGQLCHIEAAEQGGERYNTNQTDEERRAAANLMFFCYPHHQETNDTKKYTVEVLKNMKADHEALPPSSHSPDKIVEAVLRLEQKWATLGVQLAAIIGRESARPVPGYAIHTPDGKGPWVPEQGKFYDYLLDDGTKFRVMMKDDIAHIEQTLCDGAVAYYEVNEAGDLKQNKLPYPLEEYRVDIPPNMIVGKSSRPYEPGLTETTYTLKWGRSVRMVQDVAGRLIELDLHARSQIRHSDRIFEVIEPRP
jgi:hypothetical protein